MKAHGLALLIAIGAGVVLRTAFLDADSVWLDEAFSVKLVAETTYFDLWGHADSRHPPLYYALLKAVLFLAGPSDVAARALSAAASVLNLALVYVLARRLSFRNTPALLASSLLALSPIDVWYAHEVRMYALATTANLLVALALTVEGVRGAGFKALSIAFAVFVDYTTLPVLAALCGVWGARWWHQGRRATEAVWIVLAIALATAATRPLWDHLAGVAQALDSVTAFTRLRTHAPWFHVDGPTAAALMAGVTLCAALMGAYALARARPQQPSAASSWIVASVFLIANAALVAPRAFSAKQILVTAWPFVVLIAAWFVAGGGAAVRSGWRPAAALACCAVASIASLQVHRADWRGVVAYLDAHASPHAHVVLDPSWNRIPFEHYRPRLTAIVRIPAQISAVEGDVWLVAERFGQPPPTSRSEAWLDANAQLIDVVGFSRLDLKRYRLERAR